MAKDIEISIYSSLNFSDDWKLSFQQPVDYIQKFLPSDIIRVQYRIDSDASTHIELTNMKTGNITVLQPFQFTDYPNVYEIVLDYLTVGCYQFDIYLGDELSLSTSFCICESLPETVKLSYTHYRNWRQNVFVRGEYFDLRFEASILPVDMVLNADTNGFRDQETSYHQLSSFAYRSDVLTFGGGFGVPNWLAEKINRVFDLFYIFLDGESIVRSEESAPETETIGTVYYPLFLYKIGIEKGDEEYLDPSIGDFNNDFNNDFYIGYGIL